MPLPPCILDPIIRPKPWGGDWIQSRLGKSIPPGVKAGESWEAASLHSTSNRIAEGPGAGGTLADLLGASGPEILGGVWTPETGETLPLLFKYIHARGDLSIQVHPDHALAEKHTGRGEGKTEAWRVLAAEEGASIRLGLEQGIDREAFEQALAEGGVVDCLAPQPVRPGDTYLIPAGLIHTVGGGVLFAEIQEASDITYRFSDWGRKPPGESRPVDTEKSFEAADLSLRGPFRFPDETSLERGGIRHEVFRCDAFVFEVLEGDGRWEGPRAEGFEILSVARGECEVVTEGGKASLPLGGTALLPKGKAPLILRMRGAEIFRSYLPGQATA